MTFFVSEKHASGKDGPQLDKVQESLLFRYYINKFISVLMEDQVLFFSHNIHYILHHPAEGYSKSFSAYPIGTIVSFIQE